MSLLDNDKLKELVEQAIADFYMPPLDGDCEIEERDAEDHFILLERGHYGQTWMSWHPTLESASEYALNQEYAEDWEPTVLINAETGKQFAPVRIEWAEVPERSE